MRAVNLALLSGLVLAGCRSPDDKDKTDPTDKAFTDLPSQDLRALQSAAVAKGPSLADWQKPDPAPDTAAQSQPTILIQSSVNEAPWANHTAIYPLKQDRIVLKVDQLPAATIKWYQISADLSKTYKNANRPWEKNPYKWAGFAKIEYYRRELTQYRHCWQIQAFAHKTEPPPARSPLSCSDSSRKDRDQWKFYHHDVGSFWFQVEITKDARTYRSAGIEDSDHRGLSPEVFRVSLRDGPGYTGYLTTFFNVPGLFGSIPYQSNNYIGVDCADVLVAAYRKWKNTPGKRDYNVAMLVAEWPKIAEFDVKNGTPSRRLKWALDVLPGDLIAVRYGRRRRYQHIGSLSADANGNGLLDRADRIIHAGPFPLHYSSLADGNFDGHVVILRP